MVPPLSVMMTSRATIGAVAINTTPACTNQGFITCTQAASMPAARERPSARASRPSRAPAVGVVVQ
ncbi:uncharacterized protein SOCE26_097560 [Sorangium cellulosum]|uniref:Uncharacterized protein n=1 Tax=Sorangium cellulosum TaxID=56 RepID=A0A2L0F9G2_SORCE|nr:uncharacterized protein SOCE26_097560 [Sorangium cellulosum]